MKKKYIFLILINIFVILFFYNNYEFYDVTIISVNEVENIYVENSEKYTQIISGTIKNGDSIGNVITFENNATYSKVYEDDIRESTELFVSINEDTVNSIYGIKRDKYIAIVILIFIDLLVCIGKINGLKTLLSLGISVSLFIIAMNIYMYSKFNIFMLFIPFTFLFITLPFIINNGFNKKSKCAILGSITSLLLQFLIATIVLYFYSDGLYLYTMEYVDLITDYMSLFYLIIFLSSLGAIMDISITFASSVSEIINKNNKISTTNLKKSIDEISKDILGTMVNVLLFTGFTSTIPTIILAYKNNMTLYNAVDIYAQIQLVIILISAIGVIISIPINKYLSVKILHGGKV